MEEDTQHSHSEYFSSLHIMQTGLEREKFALPKAARTKLAKLVQGSSLRHMKSNTRIDDQEPGSRGILHSFFGEQSPFRHSLANVAGLVPFILGNRRNVSFKSPFNWHLGGARETGQDAC